jgi:hypothetical protein
VTRARIPAVVFVVAAVAAVAVLLVLAFGGERTRVFALRAPSAQSVATLAPGRQACEGPVSAAAPVHAVQTWGATIVRTIVLDVRVRSGGAVVATGSSEVDDKPSSHTTVLHGTVRGGRKITVCVANGGDADYSLVGSPTIDPAVAMRVNGKRSALQFSLALLGSPTDTLSQLHTAFRRASLFRPTWVGVWTYWALLAGLLLAVAACGAAVIAAARSDERTEATGLTSGDGD